MTITLQHETSLEMRFLEQPGFITELPVVMQQTAPTAEQAQRGRQFASRTQGS